MIKKNDQGYNVAIFSLMLQTCGLSHLEAADFLNEDLEQIEEWASGRERVPVDVMEGLAFMIETVDYTANKVMDAVDMEYNSVPPADRLNFVASLPVAINEQEARKLFLPCVGMQRATLGRVLGRCLMKGYKFQLISGCPLPETTIN